MYSTTLELHDGHEVQGEGDICFINLGIFSSRFGTKLCSIWFYSSTVNQPHADQTHITIFQTRERERGWSLKLMQSCSSTPSLGHLRACACHRAWCCRRRCSLRTGSWRQIYLSFNSRLQDTFDYWLVPGIYSIECKVNSTHHVYTCTYVELCNVFY